MKFFEFRYLFTFLLLILVVIASAPAESELFISTVGSDIRTSSFIELGLWCKSLGLEDNGNRQNLEERLYKYYGVTVDSTTDQRVSVLTISSAKRTEYFSIEQIEEDYVVVRGGVNLEFEDIENNITHFIAADEVIFNQTKNILTALGNISYRKVSPTTEELFTGSTITFEIGSLKGSFHEGTTYKDKTIDDTEINFSFYGDFITRSENDILITQNSVITSSKRTPPSYSIQASKMWVLAPSEWAVENAVLKVGEIPVLYFPYFFFPGDELIFNPSFGYKDREGGFIQTTTYLVGNKDSFDKSFSFMELAEDSDGSYRYEQHGLFSRKIAVEESVTESNNYFKLMVDYYSRLGFYVGSSFSLPFGPFTKLALNSGFGISRTVYYDSKVKAYTPYRLDGGEAVDKWNSAYFAGQKLPARYIFSIDSAVDLTPFNFELFGEYYSDPYVEKDFFDRAENLNWAEITGLKDVAKTKVTTTEKSSLNWNIFASSTGQPLLPPYITSLGLDKLYFSVNWKTRVNSDSSVTSFDPERRFFYPAKLITPDLQFHLSGTLFTLSDNFSETEEASETPEEDSTGTESFISPWKKEDSSGSAVAYTEFSVPELPTGSMDTSEPVDFSIDYKFVPTLREEHYTDNSGWQYPEQISFGIKNSMFFEKSNFDLNYNLYVWDTIFSMKGTLGFNQEMQLPHNRSSNVSSSDWLAIQKSSWSSSKLSVNNSLNFATMPFYDYDIVDKSEFSYSLSTLLLDQRYQGYTGTTPEYSYQLFEWDKYNISKHQVNAILKAYMFSNYQSLSAEYVIPPMDEKITLGHESRILIFHTLLSQSFQKNEQIWKAGNFIGTEELIFTDDVILKEILNYAVEENRFEKSTTSLQLYFLKADFIAAYTTPYTFGGAGTGWVASSYQEFLPQSFAISAQYTSDSVRAWKNRIAMDSKITSTFNINLLKYTESTWDFSFGFNFFLAEFLELKFTSISQNSVAYLYIPGLPEKLGRNWRNPIIDIAKSFNFFNQKDRYDSVFNLTSISIDAIHHLEDWDLTISYIGKPNLTIGAANQTDYRWDSSLSITLQWIPIPEIKTETSLKNSVFTY